MKKIRKSKSYQSILAIKRQESTQKENIGHKAG